MTLVARSRVLLLALVGTSIPVGACSEPAPRAALLGTDVNAGPESVELRFAAIVAPAHEWSEILIEIPGLDTRLPADTRLALQSGVRLDVFTTLIDVTGRELPLSEPSLVHFGSRALLSISMPALRPATATMTFSGLRLRGNVPFRADRIIWMSYDATRYKAGVAFPPESVLKDR